MPRPIKRYTHGGMHKDPKVQTALDVIGYTGEKGERKYDVNTLLDMLRSLVYKSFTRALLLPIS